MKKFVSMAMVAAMTVSMVPATAFAAGSVETTAKVLDVLELTADEAKAKKINEANFDDEVPELKIKIEGVDYRGTEPTEATAEVTLTLDNAEFLTSNKEILKSLVSYHQKNGDIQAFVDPSGGITAATSNWTQSGSGTLVIDLTQSEIDGTDNDRVEVVLDQADFEDAADYKEALKYMVEEDNTLAFDTIGSGVSAAITLTKDGETTIEVVASGETTIALTPAELSAKLQAGWTLNDADDDLKIDSTAVDALAVTAADKFADEIAKNYSGSRYERGNLAVTAATGTAATGLNVEVTEVDADEVTYKFTGYFTEDYYLLFDLESVMDKTGKGRTATVSVSGDLGEYEDMTYVSILGEGLTASTKKLTNVAEEEWTQMEKDLKIKANVSELPTTLELKVSKGFEIRVADDAKGTGYTLANGEDDDEIIVTVEAGKDEISIDAKDIIIEAVSARAGDIATIKVSAPDESSYGKATVEVAKVVDYVVTLSVEEDEDVPVIYSGVNVENYGITDDSDHLSLEITAEESFPGAWSMRKGFNFELPDGVYVTDVNVIETENFTTDETEVTTDEWEDAFWTAYRDGDHKGFEFEKRVFNDVDTTLAKDPASVTFQLELVADPGFVGDVNLKFTGDLVDEQEVTIANFATPFYVQAEQNDLKIDYRYTEIPTDITVVEAEPGLWSAKSGEETVFVFDVETDAIEFEDDPTFTVNEESGMELEDAEINRDGNITFTVDEESDDEAATVVISDMQLFMQRNIPAGAYDLEIATSMGAGYVTEVLFAADAIDSKVYVERTNSAYADVAAEWTLAEALTGVERKDATTIKEDSFVDDVADFSTTVKEAFVNVVTAGREQDDASFTTKVVVPVGESYLVSGENTVELDVPAYISAAGYTMLPVRAVANGLGISNNNVLWNGETKTVTILYGQRIITMVAGQKVINVNGSAIPASAAVEITDGRAFLPMRDLATALGVTDITWDAATKTATLNGGQAE